MVFRKIYRWMQLPFRNVIWKMNPTNKMIYLTFDDGPQVNSTEKILEILKNKNIVASFFCLGSHVEKHPELFAKIISNNHAVGNHGYNHMNGFETGLFDYIENITKANELINSKWLRPPYGKIRLSQYTALKKTYKIVLWDVFPEDYRNDITAEDIVKSVLKNVEKGSIIVLHDQEKLTVKISHYLPKLIDELKEKGYTFGKILE